MAQLIRIPSGPLLTFSSLLLSRKDHGISQLLNRSEVKSHSFYSYGRIALLDGLRILACEKGSNVLLPSYLCGVVLEPFYELGVEARFYAVSLDLQPDINDINNRIDERTKGILVVNYFGFPQKLGEIQNICQKYGLYLIEDNAHGFLSEKNSRLLGTFGDIGFSSFWKFLPVPNGAILFVNNDKLMDIAADLAESRASQDQFPQVNRSSDCTYVLNFLMSNIEFRYRFKATPVRYIYRKLFLRVDSNSNAQPQNFRVRMSKVSRRIADNINLKDVHRRRRENYDFWSGELHDRKGIRIVFNDLPEGVCPLSFPVIVEDANSFLQEMLRKEIPASRWPPLPTEITNSPDYPTANFMADHLVLLPVHQTLSPTCLARAVKK